MKLKPCPFCGGEAKQHLSVLSWVACKNCDAKTPQYQFDNQSIDAWNNRANGWIPVSVRLPEQSKKYLCCTKLGEFVLAKYNRFGDKGRWAVYGSIANSIIAWQPLPEPYKEDTK